ncbi:Protein RETICULATA-RELATED 3, chloroplastic [Ananas comosus]|uniref:Protein RETICULATA-RELATED 3, chloroplastic n=1 Tax=Ananas comosus TaxID=4615 RepID=A0A199UL48_ANACO|nr:Protein RETICULATA-RELATED 3, chloroplastic [Ananas comosus]
MAAALLRFSPLGSPSSHRSSRNPNPNPIPNLLLPTSIPFPSSSSAAAASLPFHLLKSPNPDLCRPIPSLGGGGGDGLKPPGAGSGGGGGGGGAGWSSDGSPHEDPSDPSGPLGLFIEGWRARVAADPQFPFKVLMEELVGVSACVLGDMASRPNFGLNELDFVFSTLVVGSILNFVLMYLLAPTSAAAASAAALSSLPSHMFEPGPYSLFSRLATFVYKGGLFAAVGFAAGLAGTAISNGLIAFRKRMDPNFEPPNKPPPTVLNAGTWALHMGLSSNFRYQTLNGIEFLLASAAPPPVFKVSVVVLRCLNNVLGGMSFVMLARLTGSQKVEEKGDGEEKERLIGDEPAVVAETAEELRRGEESK